MINFQIKNQKDKEQSFIFQIKKKRMFYGEILYFKKIPTQDTVALSRACLNVKIGGGEPILMVGTVHHDYSLFFVRLDPRDDTL
jgi:hypothetical protein